MSIDGVRRGRPGSVFMAAKFRPCTPAHTPERCGSYFFVAAFDLPDNRVMSASWDSFLTSRCRADRSTPQKLFCGCRHSIPAWSSFGASCRTHAIWNFARCDPRCRLMMVPGFSCIRNAPSRAPFSVMSTVCARCVTWSMKTLTGKTIFLRAFFRLSSIRTPLWSASGSAVKLPQ